MISKFMIGLKELLANLPHSCVPADKKSLRPLKKTINQFIILINKNIEDFRKNYLIKYPLEEILILSFFGVVEGAESYNEIEKYGQYKLEFLKQFGLFKNGVASHDTIRRVIMSIDNGNFEKMLLKYLDSAFKKARKYYIDKGYFNHIIIDGKSLNGSGRCAGDDKKTANHGIVNVYDAGSEITILSGLYNYDLKEDPTSERSEIATIKKMLPCLELNNSVVTLDALSFNREIMDLIRKKKGHFVIGLKANQPTLYNDVALYFSDISKKIEAQTKGYYLQQKEKEHGQIEKREWFVINCPKYFKEDNWNHISTLICLRKTITKSGDEPKVEQHYYASSLSFQKHHLLFPELVRNHWQIENNLHWHLDVSMNEDGSLIADKVGAHNFSTLRKFALVFLKLIQANETKGNKKPSVKTSRKILGWSRDTVIANLFKNLDDDELLRKFKT